MSLNGFVNVSQAVGNIFTNTGINDMLIYTSSNSQKLLIGVNSNSPGQITLSSNLTTINGGFAINSQLNMSGLTISGGGQPANSFSYVNQIAGYSNFANSNLYFVSSNNSNTNFVFMGGSNTVATLTGSGQLGIGSSNLPAYPLDVTGSARITGGLKCGGIASTITAQGITLLSPGTKSSTVNITIPGVLYFVQIGLGDPNFNASYLVSLLNTGTYAITVLAQASYLSLTGFSVSGNIATLTVQNTVGFSGYTSATVVITTIC